MNNPPKANNCNSRIMILIPKGEKQIPETRKTNS